MHGLTGSPNDFETYAAHFKNQFDVYVPLLPGHGSHVCHLQDLTVRELMIPLPPLLAYLGRIYQKVHLVGLSYGAILAISATLEQPVTSLTLMAPAFFLTPRSEKHMRLIRKTRAHRWLSRLKKTSVYRKKNFALSNPHTYQSVALRPTESLHQLAGEMVGRLGSLSMPVLHMHGDCDDTTPLQPNHELLKMRLKRYDFLSISGGRHVLTLAKNNDALASHHLNWLQRHHS